ncbi:MAG: hypothetical protein Q8R65_06600 [Polynucleobacter sp.]|nr:hypothetical protein [Polynucleobacter sp.]MDZ4057838.1 hypothetical protein [Polynucleobacter sp.]
MSKNDAIQSFRLLDDDTQELIMGLFIKQAECTAFSVWFGKHLQSHPLPMRAAA